MLVTRQGNLSCNHKWLYMEMANTQYCVICGRCETPDC